LRWQKPQRGHFGRKKNIQETNQKSPSGRNYGRKIQMQKFQKPHRGETLVENKKNGRFQKPHRGGILAVRRCGKRCLKQIIMSPRWGSYSWLLNLILPKFCPSGA
jgi:Na+-transporting NADH:ubiquinone oxidoreductase subunit NqrA